MPGFAGVGAIVSGDVRVRSSILTRELAHFQVNRSIGTFDSLEDIVSFWVDWQQS